jgi:hypothetical protein
MSNADLNGINQLVLLKQHLADDSQTDDIVQIVKDIGGLHATSSTTPYLSLFARMHNFMRDNLDEELYVKRNLGKIRCMRKTLYILTKEMIPIACAATRGVVEKNSKQFLEFRGVPYKEYEEISKLILNILKNREMTALEVKKTLKTQLNVSAILNLMCDQGLLMRGRPEKGWKDSRQKYSLFREYFPDMDFNKTSEKEATTLLVQNYLHSFGPVTENDIAWWIGLSKTKVREALNHIQDQIIRVEISNLKGNFITLHSDKNLIMSTKNYKKRTVNLLPTLDPYLMGYKERERYLELGNYNKVFDSTGNATSTILLDGRVVGVWDFSEDAEPTVKIFLFEEIEGSVLKEIRLKAQKIGKFIADKEVKIKECDSMVPLNSRSPGGVMSPLKDS